MKFGSFLSLFLGVVLWTGAALGSTSLDTLLPPKPLQGWVLTEGPRPYDRKTLFEHINGQAELYLKYGYERSVFGMYQHGERAVAQIEVDIYDMGNALQAFGVYSRMRIEGRSAGVGLDSSMDDRSLLFYKGRYFVILDGTGLDPSSLKGLAERISAGITDGSPPPREILLFPRRSLKPGSIQYLPEGLLGHRFLKRGFQGTYFEGGKTEVKVEAKTEAQTEAGKDQKEFHLILVILKDKVEAKKALASYRDYLLKKGKVESKIPGGLGSRGLAGEDPYHGKVYMVQRGTYLVGVTGFKNEEEALGCLAETIQKVK